MKNYSINFLSKVAIFASLGFHKVNLYIQDNLLEHLEILPLKRRTKIIYPKNCMSDYSKYSMNLKPLNVCTYKIRLSDERAKQIELKRRLRPFLSWESKITLSLSEVAHEYQHKNHIYAPLVWVISRSVWQQVQLYWDPGTGNTENGIEWSPKTGFSERLKLSLIPWLLQPSPGKPEWPAKEFPVSSSFPLQNAHITGSDNGSSESKKSSHSWSGWRFSKFKEFCSSFNISSEWPRIGFSTTNDDDGSVFGISWKGSWNVKMAVESAIQCFLAGQVVVLVAATPGVDQAPRRRAVALVSSSRCCLGKRERIAVQIERGV